MRSLVYFLSYFILFSCSSSYVDKRESSKHFWDGEFHNPSERMGSFFSYLKMRMDTDFAEWPKWIESKEGDTPPKNISGNSARITLINHATALIQVAGLNILTDPIYSERCSPVSWMGPKRVRAPGISFDKLPKIDLVIISHDHYDHLDLDTIKRLQKRDNPKIYMGLGVGQRLNDRSNIVEMDWWQSSNFNEELVVNFVPVQHFSGRGLFDRNSTLWGGYVLEVNDFKIYFGGDSGYADHYKQTYKKFGAMDISLLPIGAYGPRWFMKYAHLNPEEAVVAHKDLHSKKSIGIHYGTFQLTSEPINEPVEKIIKQRSSNGLSSKDFEVLEFGNSSTIYLNN